MPPPRILAISTEIGRGHPSYLDSLLKALSSQPGIDHDSVQVSTIDEINTGFSRAAWAAAKRFYRSGAQGGIRTSLYNRLRGTGRPSALQLGLLGASLKKHLAGFKGTCIVEHPLIAHVLTPVCRVAYLHAEIAAPAVAAVPGAWRTFVPLELTRRRLVEAGIAPQVITVTGLVIEPELVSQAEPAYGARLQRLSRSDSPLTVGFFTSGAYPKPHLERTVAGVQSCLEAGHKVIVFAGTDARKAMKLRDRLPSGRTGLDFIVSTDRRAETTRTAELFGGLDVMVAAAHERTNWAVGLGLPMFALLPNIGPFSPQNYELACKQDVCRSVETAADAVALGPAITKLRQEGKLHSMAEHGYGPHPVGGAEVAASALLAGCT